MKLSFINFNMKMTPSKLLTSVFYDHLSFKSPLNNLVKYENTRIQEYVKNTKNTKSIDPNPVSGQLGRT